MRNPVRSEADAFHIVVGSAAVIVVSVVVGALLSPLVGVALLVGAVAGALFWELATVDPDRRQPLRDAAADGRQAGARGRSRVLVVANRTLTSELLRAELARRSAAGAELSVVAPILASRAHYIATDIDRELQDARDRVSDTLAWAEANGVQLSGRVGDPIVALGAIEDELRRSGFDEVLIATLPPKQSNWLETGILTRLRNELDIPVTHTVVDLDRAATTA
jgi:GABA permease